MMKKVFLMLAVGAAALIFCGCVSSEQPANTSAGLTGLQQRALNIRNIGDEFGATYRDVWYSTISTLQLNGFILKEADMRSGYIYGVWQDTYERRSEITNGGFSVYQFGGGSNLGIGSFFGKTDTYKQVEVSVTLEPVEKTQTLVRLVARFDNAGVPVAEGVFANRFFGLLRKEIFLRKNGGSVYNKRHLDK